MSACGLRRPHRLEVTESRLAMVKPTDFGLESAFPRFMDASSKRAMIAVFISFCKISDIMMQITVFLREKSLDWRQGQNDFASPVLEIHQVRAFDSQLEGWKLAFWEDCGDVSAQTLPGCKMQFYTLEVLYL
jgi:hypothetical protein